MKNSVLLLGSVALLASASLMSPSMGQDAGLYDNAIDPSKAYVRLVVEGNEQTSVAGSPVTVLEHSVTGYVSVAPGAVAVESGENTASLDVEAGLYYTFVAKAGSFTAFTDPAIADPSKAEVLFYNLTEQANVDLFVPAAKTNALTGVAAGTSQSVELRAPLSLGFEVRAGDKTIATIADVALQRKQAVSLLLTEGANGVELVQVVNSFADAK